MQRPSVILRGNDGPGHHTTGVSTVYLVSFTRVIFVGGAVQYQQVHNSGQKAGFFDFYYCQTESRSVTSHANMCMQSH
jgi:hypothetical protein